MFSDAVVSSASEQKLQNHMEHSITCRDPGIQSLAKKYNELCSKMTGLIQSRRAPANAVAPKPIVIKELFSLDVDDSIWDDIGLSDDDDTAEPPLWLCDEHVRTGIRGILLRDRCDEEFLCLKHELLALKEWFMEEWLIVARAMEDTEGMWVNLNWFSHCEICFTRHESTPSVAGTTKGSCANVCSMG